ncbi:MAG: Gfo/Idh/MocA family oxidoreductase [Bacteroidota bacterium]
MNKTKIGIVGLGRLGKSYAENIAFRIRNADLVAACSLDAEELRWAKEELGVAHCFEDYTDMLKLKELDSIFIISSTDMHATHIIEALEAGFHVFCEKPMASSVEDCLKVEEVAQKYPNQKAVVGFVRRYDRSYRYAWDKIQAGAIGEVFMVRSQTVDKDTLAGFQLEYAGSSGGLFHDYNVHDVDLARWFLKDNVAEVWSLGGAYKYTGFAEIGDADNVVSSCRFEKGGMAVIHASRTAMHGHDTYTEITGTLGTLRIGRPAGLNRVEIYDQNGVRKECVETFWDRFEEAFLLMAQDFVDCLLAGKASELSLRDATEATLTTTAMTHSFKNGKLEKIHR